MEVLNENGKTYLKGIMTEANKGSFNSTDFSSRGANRNGRFYEFNILKEAVLSLKERVESNNIYTYLDHPNHEEMVESDSAGKIVELDWIDESGRAHCKIELLDYTTSGKKIIEDVSKGKNYGISTRGRGSLDENNCVKEGLYLITSDLIPQFDGSMQSCQSCSLSITESIQQDYSDFLIESKEDCMCDYNKLDETEKNIVQKHIFNELMKVIESKLDLRGIKLVLSNKKDIDIIEFDGKTLEINILVKYLDDAVKKINTLLKIKLEKQLVDSGDTEVYKYNDIEFGFNEMKNNIKLIIGE